MALAIGIEAVNTGVMATYWRIGEIRITTPPDGADTATVRVDGFASAEARNAGKDRLMASEYSFPLSVLEGQGTPGLRDTIKAMLYETLKSRPEFAGASSV